MTEPAPATEAATIADLATRAARQLELRDVADGRQIVVLPNGQHHYISAEDMPLLFVRRATTHQTVASFVQHVAGYATPATAVFCDIKQLSICAVIDYDTPPDDDIVEPVAGRAQHKADLKPVETTEWETLTSVLNRWIDRDSFSDLVAALEELIVDPDQATIATLAEQINVKTETQFSAGERRRDGTRTLKFVEKATATGGGQQTVNVPDKVVFQVQPHTDSALYRLPCKFRFQAREGVLKLRLDFTGLAALSRKIFEDYRTRIMDDDRLVGVRSVTGRP